jgi:glyoxylase-like metal-dependent hydrolase (beta-lactamase superfamily II)
MIAHSKKVGDIEVTALSGGLLATSLDVVLGMDRAEVRRLTGATDRDEVPHRGQCLSASGKWALIDAGAGNSMGPTLGKLPEHLRAFGVALEEIRAVFLTHIHPDHSNGLVDDMGNAVYPNAELILHEAEAKFWLDRDEASGETERIRRNIEGRGHDGALSRTHARRRRRRSDWRCPATRLAIPDG